MEQQLLKKPEFQKKSSSRFFGVMLTPNGKKWRSQLRIKGRFIYLGTFDNELIAAAEVQRAMGNMENYKRLLEWIRRPDGIENIKQTNAEKKYRVKLRAEIKKVTLGNTVSRWMCKGYGGLFLEPPDSCKKCLSLSFERIDLLINTDGMRTNQNDRIENHKIHLLSKIKIKKKKEGDKLCRVKKKLD